MPEPHDAARDTPPCAQLLVLGGRVGELERRLDEHNRIQNSHLQDINRKLEGLGAQNVGNAQERTQQIGDLRSEVVERFNRVLLAAIGFGVPVMAGLLYLILNQALKTP